MSDYVTDDANVTNVATSEGVPAYISDMGTRNTNSVVVVGIQDWEVWQHAQRLARTMIDERVKLLTRFYIETGVQPAHAQPIDIVRWIAEHDEWSTSTVSTYTSYLNAWFRWLQVVDRRVDDPMIKVGKPRVPRREPHPIADSEVPKLLNTRMWGTTRAMILLALLAGLRAHEIAKVRGEDFDIAANLLWVKGKRRSVKSVPLHPVLRELASNMPSEGWWFPMRGHPALAMHRKSVSDVVGRTMRRAGVRGSCHSLRHWYGTALLDDGHDIRVVQELMRHESIQSTQVYTLVPNARRRDAIAGLDLMRGTRAA